MVVGLLISPATAHRVGAACGFSVEVPKAVALTRVLPGGAFCSYVEVSKQAGPFVNSIARARWTDLEWHSRIPGEASTFGNFSLANRSAKYQPPIDYHDDKNSVRQTVLRHESLKVGDTEQAFRTDLEVSWLQPSRSGSVEMQRTFTCIDAAKQDADSVVLLNWCAASGSRDAANPEKMFESLELHKSSRR